MPDRRIFVLSALLALTVPVFAEEAGEPAQPAGKGLPIMFLPPPMEGTISLGIYNGAGKLVRILHREAEQKEFKVGENGLITRWDGSDEAGRPLPQGKYNANGWMAGDLGVEGVAFHGNDWIKDESPRYSRVTGVRNIGRDEVRVTLRTVEGKDEVLSWKLSREGVEPPKNEIKAAVEDGGLIVRKNEARLSIPLGDGAKALTAVVGNGERIWAIIETPGGREVRAYSAQGEFLRRLTYRKNEPQPLQLAASLWNEMIFLLDENETEQRLRALALGTSDEVPQKAEDGAQQPAGVSTWRITYFKRVLKMDSFDAVAAQLGREKPLKAEAATKIQARANPLLEDRKVDVFVKVSVDVNGAVLKTADDLPLAHLTNTPNLKWAALVKEGTALLLFQCDGSVVEEFTIGRPGNMMSFDAGGYELKAPGGKSAPPKGQPGLVPKRSQQRRPGDEL